MLQRQVQVPPAFYLERFYDPTRRVVLTWVAVARTLAAQGHNVEVTSWWRDFRPAGGALYSQHLVGTALDALSPRLTRAQLLPIVQRAAAAYGTQAPSQPSEGSGRTVHVQGLPPGTVQHLVLRNPQVFGQAAAFVGPPRPVV